MNENQSASPAQQDASSTQTESSAALDTKTKQKRYLTPKEILSFCLVLFTQQTVNEYNNANAQYFVIQFLKLNPQTYGNLTFATGVYDAIDDTISGLIIDRTRTRWGRVKPYIVLPLPLIIISTMMTFSAPALGPTAKIVYTCVAMLLRGLAFSYFGAWYLILYNNTPNITERDGLITTSEFAKLFSSWLTSLIPVFLDLGKSTGMSETSVYSIFTIIFMALTCVICFFGFMNMRERLPLQSREEMNEVSILESFKQLLKNRPMFVLILGNFFNSFKSVGSANEKFFWFNCTGTYSYATIAGLFTGIPNYIMTPLTGKWIKKYGARATIIAGGLFGGVAYILMWLIGYHPFGSTFNDNKIANLVWMIFALTIVGLPNSIIRVCLPVLQGDLYDYSEWKTGVRNEAIVNTVRGYFEKLGYNINGWLAGAVLSWINYVALTDANGSAIPNTDPKVMKGLWAIFALAPAAARLFTGLVFFLFNVHGKFKEQILIDLEERREARINAMEREKAESVEAK